MFAMCSKLSETWRRCSARSLRLPAARLEVMRALAGQPLEQRVGVEEAEQVVEVREEEDEGEGEQREVDVEGQHGDEVVLGGVLHQDGVEGDRRRQEQHPRVHAVLQEELEELQGVHVRGEGHGDGDGREHHRHQLVPGAAEGVDEVPRLVCVEGAEAREGNARAQRVGEDGGGRDRPGSRPSPGSHAPAWGRCPSWSPRVEGRHRSGPGPRAQAGTRL